MLNISPDSKRKQDHIDINLTHNVDSLVESGFSTIRLMHHALPELDYNEIDISTKFLGKNLNAPILISSMTGGTDHARIINRNLAIAAQKHNIALALGSMRVLLSSPDTQESFYVRDLAPDIILLANIGAVQLNYGVTTEDCQKLVDQIKADGLILHLNLMQELTQPEGNKNWSGLFAKIASLTERLSVPVIIKEVGYGISYDIAKKLFNLGINHIDVAGAGGTSWTQVEFYRAHSHIQAKIASAFRDWGITTIDSIKMVKQAALDMNIPNKYIIASGGIRSGVDGAKAIALGADLFALAKPFLQPATINAENVSEELTILEEQLKIAMLSSGVRNITQLQHARLECMQSN